MSDERRWSGLDRGHHHRGGIAGWLAEQFMKSSMGMIMNIVLGIVGAAIASAILSYFGIVLGGWVGYLISAERRLQLSVPLHWRGLADLDRLGRAAGLRTSRPTSKREDIVSRGFRLHGMRFPVVVDEFAPRPIPKCPLWLATQVARRFGRQQPRSQAVTGLGPQSKGRTAEQDGEEDIMTYVLIVVSWLGGAVNGAVVSTQEFTSAERCEAARLALIEYAKARGLEETLRPICMQK
jgi:hypothetical protein